LKVPVLELLILCALAHSLTYANQKEWNKHKHIQAQQPFSRLKNVPVKPYHESGHLSCSSKAKSWISFGLASY